MSLRDVLIKSSELELDKIALVSEMKGNPSKIDFHDEEGELILSLDVTVSIPNSNASSKSRVKTKSLQINSEIDELKGLGNILGISEFHEGSTSENILLIKKGDVTNRAVIEFYGDNGIQTGPKIFIKNWRQ